MASRLPIAIAGGFLAALGFGALALSGGVEALIGPALAGIVSTIFVLLRQPAR